MIYVRTAQAKELYPTLLEQARQRYSEPASEQAFRFRQAARTGRISRPNARPFGRDRVWFHCDLKQVHHLLASVAGPNAFVQTYMAGTNERPIIVA